MLSHIVPVLTFSTLRGAVVPVLLLLAVAWTAGCEREGATDPTAAAPTTAARPGQPGETEGVSRRAPSAIPTASPPTSVATVTPSLTAAPTATLVPWQQTVTIGDPWHPCGPGARQIAHRRFLHWANGTSTLIVDVGQEIWQVDTGGEWVREVADLDPQSEHDSSPMLYGHYADVSPDGSRIVYSTCEYSSLSARGEYELAAANVDGTGRQRLTESYTFDNYPVWSPDGAYIAFIAQSEGLHYEPQETRILTMAADGSDVAVVPNTEGVGLYPPVWSPDGERLAFTVNEKWPSRIEKRILYTVRVDGSELSRIGEVSTLPTWSPDSERLAFGFNRPTFGGGEFDPGVYTVRFDGSDARQVMDLRVRQAHWSPEHSTVQQVSWSPDGSELLIASDLLFTVRPDGSDLRAFSQLGLALIVNATWSPDGSWIAVEQSVSPYYPDFWAYVVSVMTRDGTDVTIVAEGGSDEGSDPFIRQYTPPLPPAACSAGVVVPEPEANPGLVQDCETLVGAVGRLVELPAWEALGWNADTPIAEWSRVTVGGDPPRIRELMLGQSGLTGMPGELRKLQMLEVLYLHGNEMSGAIPPELGKLSMLKTLNLAGNWLTGPIPPELGKLTMLEELDLYRNYLTGPIPPELGKLALLESLALEGNELSGCVPVEFPDIWVRRSDLARCEP